MGNDEKNFTIFCKCAEFLHILLQMLQGFWIGNSEHYLPEVSCKVDAFSSHKSYEIGLFYLMSLVEKNIYMKDTMKTLVETNLLCQYISLLAGNIGIDISYATQVEIFF
jgi:hypothetical protein